MATVTNGSAGAAEPFSVDPLAVGAWRGGDAGDSKSDRYLARRLAAAGADYKGVALTTFLFGVGVGTVLWLAIGVLAEHWLVPGGLSRPLRWAWFVAGVVALGAAILRWVVPLVRYRVNLVYAARAIEREHPELHNDLVNTVLVKAHPEASPPLVVRTLERRTAKQLSDVPLEGVIDRSTALRLAYALAALVALACLYQVFAPKSLLVSAGRLLAPWTAWAAPSRVSIAPVELSWRHPDERRADDAADDGDRRRLAIDSGAATLVRGRQLVVSADIHGLRRDERPMVTVAPLNADGAVGQAAASWQAEMTRTEAAGLKPSAVPGRTKRFAAVLPDATRGLDQSVEITIAAGDARCEPVRIAVVDSPSLLVREVRYDYPAYTRKPSETVAWQGDLRAVEGTQVSIVAESNQPLDAAWIDFDCDGDNDLAFNKKATDLTRMSKSFPLQMNADRSGPAHAMYRLVFRPRSASGAERERPVAEPMEHRIEVIPDLAPEVSIEEPRESPARVPPGAPVVVRVRALDPDFALARVGIETRLRGGAIQPAITLLDAEKTGVFKGAGRLVPERLGAGPGSVLEYRAVAVDTRPESPNVSYSQWQSLEIDASAAPRPPEEPAPRSAGDREGRAGGGDEGPGDSGNEERAAGSEPATGDEGADGEKQSPDQQQRQDQAGDRQQRQGAERQKEQSGESKQQQQQRPEQQQSKQGEQQSQQEQQQKDPQQKKSEQPSKPQQGKQDGAAESGQQGGKQEQPGESQKGDKQGAGANQGQGAGQGQGVGAQGDRQGGQQSGSQKSQGGKGDKPGDMKAGGEQQGGKDQAGKQQGGKSGAGKEQTGGQSGGTPKPKQSVASDGTNDGEAMERILDHRRQEGGEKKPGDDEQAAAKQGGNNKGDKKNDDAAPCNKADGKPCENGNCSTCSGGGKSGDGAGKAGAGKEGQGKEGQGKEEDGRTSLQQDKVGKVGKVTQQQKQDGDGQINQQQRQDGQNNVQQNLDGKVGDVTQQQQQDQRGQIDQQQSQSGQNNVQQDMRAVADDVKQQESQQQQGKVAQQQEQDGQNNIQQQSDVKLENVTQQEQQDQKGSTNQQQRQDGQNDLQQKFDKQPGDVNQQQKQDQKTRVDQQQSSGKNQDGASQTTQGQGDQNQTAVSQDQQAQKQQGQTVVGQSQQHQTQQGQTLVDQSQQSQTQQGQSLVSQSQQGRAQEANGLGGVPQQRQGQEEQTAGDSKQTKKETEWGEQDLRNARNAADLAIEHLRGAVESGDTGVLDRLGWTREQARAFLDRWEKMRRMAESEDPAVRGDFERAVRSLGLRPDGVQNRRDVPSDVRGGQAEGRRSSPPSEYREQFKAYTQGTAGE